LHWQKLGKFRKNHPSIGAGVHKMVSEKPYLFSRKFSNGIYSDEVLISLDLKKGMKSIEVSSVFTNGEILRDAYSKKEVKVENGRVELNTSFEIVLLEKK
jgi:alpha-amylase